MSQTKLASVQGAYGLYVKLSWRICVGPHRNIHVQISTSPADLSVALDDEAPTVRVVVAISKLGAATLRKRQYFCAAIAHLGVFLHSKEIITSEMVIRHAKAVSTEAAATVPFAQPAGDDDDVKSTAPAAVKSVNLPRTSSSWKRKAEKPSVDLDGSTS
eukprot:CAMPEP_0178468110 /NCGR_PEP_ID=MMETSP0689_2-20121128/52752_1 /TAXON_ID=160604 /ORGANISM="Amphidinium massartii, Strain CS-259" /LENGTH=158 /DNA_ID=CAMNT_0020095159 /DNA_START=31 /DNA_END=508 /DNA_ORIENTATION=-